MTSSNDRNKSHHLTIALGLAALGWLAMGVQELLLFLRPTPFGDPYVGTWQPYLVYALIYNSLGIMIASVPSLLFWLVTWRRAVGPGLARRIHYLQLTLLIITTVLDHLDNEVMRFMGIHLTYGLLRTYWKVNAWGDDMYHIILGDKGGVGLPFLILVLVPLVLWWAGRRIIGTKPLRLALPLPIGIALTAIPVLVPLLVHEFRHPGQNRKFRVQPEILTLYSGLQDDLAEGNRPSHFETLAREYQATWFQQSGDTGWRFPDPERPLIREPLTPAVRDSGGSWNIILIQLETFRGWNTGFLRPDFARSPTPFLDSLARDTASAFWRRHLSFGPPTVSGFMAVHCSIKPHSRDNITASFTYTALDCLPTVLRQHGYHAELFTGFDPDWDNQGLWMRKWYNAFHYNNEIKNQDRLVFRRAAERIRELGRAGRPFLATLISISNHVPFRARHLGTAERRFDLDPDSPPGIAINNTMRYTDDVVRELVDTLAKEPWFKRTLVVITGDHGYDLGEHGTPGQSSGWRESVWVPLLIHGAHPRLPKGGHDELASLMDIPPTLADLAGVRQTTSWMGSSLVAEGHTGSPFAFARYRAIFGEQGRFSMVVHPETGKGLLFDALKDPLQRQDISAQYPGIVASLKKQAERERRLVDYLVEANLVWHDSRAETRESIAASTQAP